VLFVGIAPGWEEDRDGECFVGKAGKKLMEMVEEANLDLDDIRFSNLVRCVPWKSAANPGKVRDPKQTEIDACHKYLLKEIARTQPDIIVPLGKVPTYYFLPHLGPNLKITKYNGVSFSWTHPKTEDEYTIVPTLHPAAVCRNDNWRPKVLEALTKVKNLVLGKTSEDIFSDCDYQYLNTEKKIKKYVDMVIQKHLDDPANKWSAISIDYETGFADHIPDDYPIDTKTISLTPYNPYNVVVSVQLSHAPKKGALIPLWHKDSPFKDIASIMMIAGHLQRLVDVVPVMGQNYKFDCQVGYVKLGVVTKKFLFDSMLAHFLMYQKMKPLGLEELAGMYVEMPMFKREMHKALESLPEDKRHMGNVDLDKLIRYGCGDADAVWRLYEKFRPEMEEMGFWEVYEEILQDATLSLANVEINGMRVDPERLEILGEDLREELDELLDNIRAQDIIEDFDVVARRRYDEKKEETRRQENKKREKEGVPPIKSVKVRPEILEKREAKLAEKLKFNPGSPTQLKMLFYEPDLMAQVVRHETKTKQPSTDKKARRDLISDINNEISLLESRAHRKNVKKRIKELRSYVSLVRMISDWTGKDKLYSSYIKNANVVIPDKGDIKHKWPISLPKRVCPWCFHANFKIHGTDTGRLSCSKPNLQQVPKKAGALIKWMFVSRWMKKGGVLLQGDYSQAELRVMAQLAGEKSMMDAFNRGEDIHLFVASMVFGLPIDKITKKLRGIAKAASFGILYGQGPRSLSEQFETSEEEAKVIIRKFYERFPAIKDWQQEKKDQCKQYDFVDTPMGRIRRIYGATSRDNTVAGEAFRKAINTPIQSAASDWTLCSLNEIVKRIQARGLNSLVVATVHDSIMVDVYPGELLQVMEIMYNEMVIRLPKRFPWISDVIPKTDFEFGVDWRSMVDISKHERGYKLSGDIVNIKKNIKHLKNSGVNFEQLDMFFDAVGFGDKEEDEKSWVLAAMEW